MKHLGDITKIDGHTAPVVDVVIGGSPCQDLSIAGKRAGLAGERSGLYMEQIRIIKEMRERDRATGRAGQFIRPRYMVWENVPGAFSSNGGADFAAVLEEAIKIAEPEAPSVSVPEKGWPTSGCIMGDEWSVAWRVLDAQFWGVAQRRRRIALVADFGGQSAPEVLFVREGLSGHPEEGGTPRETATGVTERGVNKPIAYGISAYESNSMKSGNPRSGIYVANTSRTLDSGNCCNPACNQGGIAVVYDAGGNGDGATVPTITGDHEGRITDYTSVILNDQGGTIQTHSNGGQGLNCSQIERVRRIVRRLTPLECERLQGFPDGWTDIGEWVESKGKRHKPADTPRYKALGNSIALPPWKWVLKRLCAQYERDATMASLFDGIGGFPLIWEQLNGRGTCLWASEIEEFTMAVTERRFGDKMRLIDAESLLGSISNAKRYLDAYNILSYVMNAPTVDAVSVIRCRDCRHRGTDECPMHINGQSADEAFLRTVDDDYCSHGERCNGEAVLGV